MGRANNMNRIALRLSLVALLAGAVFLATTPDNSVFAQEDQAQDTAEQAADTAEAPADARAADADPSEAIAAAPDAEPTAEVDADEAPAEEGKFDWRGSGVEAAATAFLSKLHAKKWADAYAEASELTKQTRTGAEFERALKADRFDEMTTFQIDNGVPAKGGYRLSGTFLADEGQELPFNLTLLGDEALRAKGVKRDWSSKTTWNVLDLQANPSLLTRVSHGTLAGLDYFVLFFTLVILGALVFMIVRYVVGLSGSPRELYLMFFTKLTEYSAYGAASYTFVLYLAQDVGLGDQGGTAYYTVFALTMTVVTMVVGAVCDIIGVKKSLLIGTGMLLTARFFMPLTTDIVVVSILGFLPMAIGSAITGPVLKVGIKKFTTIEGATLGFGLFYTLMNVGFAVGGWMFDAIRTQFGDGGSVMLPLLGELSTYQIILGVGFFINIPDLIAVLIMREGAEMTENGPVLHPPKKADNTEVDRILAETHATRTAAMRKEVLWGAGITLGIVGLIFSFQEVGAGLGKWGMATLAFVGLIGASMLLYGAVSLTGLLNQGFDRVMYGVRTATEETGRLLVENFRDRPFWIYLWLLGILTFVRLTFYIFHIWFPTYGIRVFGEGAMVGSIFGVLNPLLIVFLVPLISIMTMKIRSYEMLMIGTLVSAASVFLCFIPDSVALSLANGPFGTLVFDYWLEVPIGQRDPFYISLIIFIVVFTVGEAIWSPRLMQFSAEIAPRGKEGSYIALSMLPYFVGKALAGGMSGFLLANYTPEGLLTYPDHQSAWLWIGGMAMLSPIGMLMFQKTFKRLESDAMEDAQRHSEEEAQAAAQGA